MDVIQANVSDDSAEVLHLRGYVRGYVYRLQGRDAPSWMDTERRLPKK